MSLSLYSLISFVLITTFSPGPNNITSASSGLNYGFRKTFKYLLGIAAGFFVIMILCGWISKGLLSYFPGIDIYLGFIGGLYILWLAFHTLKASFEIDERNKTPMTFLQGMMLQLLNPKVIVYGLTIYSTFLKDMNLHGIRLMISALILALVSLCSTTTWTVTGNIISTYLNINWINKSLNMFFFILLVITAYKISGIDTFIFQ
jgi:cysteine/O-acetylserine efflux protein